MQTVVLEFDDEKSLREAVDHLWHRLRVTGEINVQPLGKGSWRLEIIAEKGLRPNTLEKLKGRLVE